MKLHFVIGIHCHQPVGNPPQIIDEITKKCYLPFLKEVYNYPQFKFSLHYSGNLLKYMKENQREVFELISDMVKRGQVELLSGGFYEPIFTIIPERDAIGQIKKMNEFIYQNFGVKPSGMWLTERTWEPHLPRILRKADIEYTILDDTHFFIAGIKNIHKYYITESEGFTLKIFPIDKNLRYLIPFRKIDELERYLRDISKEGDAIYADDGEKFGSWLGTYEWVYEKGWLRDFLSFITNCDWIETLTFSEYMSKFPPEKLIFIPPASYDEMMEWVLPPEDGRDFLLAKREVSDKYKKFLRGGFFRQFFVKYPESNNMHKKMIYVSEKVASMPDGLEKEKALDLLYRGQVNDPYWHGVFGGIYLPSLREEVYKNLICAEKITDEKMGWKEFDFDKDGKNEIIFENEKWAVYVKPDYGGCIFELDFRTLNKNLLNVLTRREETYHTGIEEVKVEEGIESIHEIGKKIDEKLQKYLVYDRYRKVSLLDHIVSPDVTPEDFNFLHFKDFGDFVGKSFDREIKEDKLILHRKAGNFEILKEIKVKEKIEIFYKVKGEGNYFYCNEWSILLFDGQFKVENNKVVMFDKLILEFSGADKIFYFPIKCVSQSESGFELTHQGYTFIALWELCENLEFTIKLISL